MYNKVTMDDIAALQRIVGALDSIRHLPGEKDPELEKLLNEINRDEVYDDILKWLNGKCGK